MSIDKQTNRLRISMHSLFTEKKRISHVVLNFQSLQVGKDVKE